MGPSFRLRFSLGVLAFVLPAVPVACTADQFTSNDGGTDATFTDAPGSDGTNDVTTGGDGATKDGTLADGGGSGDAIAFDGPIIGDVKVSDAPCTTLFGTYPCGNTFSCNAATSYCNEKVSSGACDTIPIKCACDPTCPCMLGAMPNFCDGGIVSCATDAGLLTLSCP